MTSSITKKRTDTLNNDPVINLASQLIQIPSFTYEESEIATFLHKFLDRSGLNCELQEVPLPNGKISHQVIARLKGTSPGKKILLCGHLDILEIYQRENWATDPFQAVVSDGWLYGQGILNMKSGLALLIGAILKIHNENIDFQGEIVFAGVAAEIIGGSGITHFLRNENNFDYAIVAEPTNLSVSTISVGTGQGMIRLCGETHYYKPHLNPIYAMANLIQNLGEAYAEIPLSSWMTFTPCDDLIGFPRFNIRTIQSGQDFCEITFDARLVPGQNSLSLKNDLEKIIEKLSKKISGLEYKIFIPYSDEFRNFPAMTATDEKSPLIQALVKNHFDCIGKYPIVGSGDRIGLASDSSHIKAVGIPAVDYGPGNHPTWPMINERIKVDEVKMASEVIFRTLKDLLK